MDKPELRYDVLVKQNVRDAPTRIAEFVCHDEAAEFAASIQSRYAYVFVGGIVRDLQPEPLHITVTLDGKNIAQVEAFLTRVERVAGQFEPYIDSMIGA